MKEVPKSTLTFISLGGTESGRFRSDRPNQANTPQPGWSEYNEKYRVPNEKYLVPVVTTVDEAVAMICMGQGVGLDFAGMSLTETKAALRRLLTVMQQFNYTGIKRAGTKIMKFVPDADRTLQLMSDYIRVFPRRKHGV